MLSVPVLQNASDSEAPLRVELAAAFRLAARHDWHESVGNHFSAAVSDDGKRFLMNPKWKHFAGLTASELLLLDADDSGTMDRPDAPDPSAWAIHGAIHAALPRARCVLHLHPPYATALACLVDPRILPIDQNTARFHNRHAVDLGFEGLANDREEGTRLAAALGEHRVMMMGNHGVLIVGTSVSEAFEDLYFLERACRTLVLAYSTGRPLNVMSDEVAEATARGWDLYSAMGDAHFAQLRAMLDEEGADYAK
jgi:ribulose-5-phosphate 4-epimerase/fuculose-1-phosphate aldolase